MGEIWPLEPRECFSSNSNEYEGNEGTVTGHDLAEEKEAKKRAELRMCPSCKESKN